VRGHGLHRPATTNVTEAHRDRTPVDAVLLALVPGALALTACFGWGTLLNLAWAWLGAGAAASALQLTRGGALSDALTSRRSLLGAALLALALPPALPWWLVCAGAVFAAGIARPLQSDALRLNPAMTTYAALLLLFPHEMSRWPAPAGLAEAQTSLFSPSLALRASFGLLPGAALDAMTMATPLDLLRVDHTHTIGELRRLYPQIGDWGGIGWNQVNAAFLAGGLWLAWRRVIAWQLPAALLGTLALLAALFNDGGSSASGGSPWLHLFAGGTMLGAFFIATDPRSSAHSTLGRLGCGVLIGVLVFGMRYRGDWPDAMALAVLLAGLAAPLLDRLVIAGEARPRTAATPATRARLALALLLGAGLLSLDWLGLRDPPRSSALPLREVLGDVAYDNRPAEDRVAVQDLALLGLTAPRDAYRARADGRISAVVLPVIAADGYGGPIELLVGIRADGRLCGVRVTRHAETPGYGDEIAGEGWISAFDNRALADPAAWRLRRNGGDFDQFTGATITPRAVVAAVHRGLQYFDAHRDRLLQDARR
jgi:electron transport complex protein RnfD